MTFFRQPLNQHPVRQAVQAVLMKQLDQRGCFTPTHLQSCQQEGLNVPAGRAHPA